MNDVEKRRILLHTASIALQKYNLWKNLQSTEFNLKNGIDGNKWLDTKNEFCFIFPDFIDSLSTDFIMKIGLIFSKHKGDLGIYNICFDKKSLEGFEKNHKDVLENFKKLRNKRKAHLDIKKLKEGLFLDSFNDLNDFFNDLERLFTKDLFNNFDCSASFGLPEEVDKNIANFIKKLI